MERLAAAITLLVHLAGNPHYGFFRDELYFIVCGRHPAFGYVDQPPLVPLLCALTQVFGESLFLLRAMAALFAAAAVWVTCVLARELGGGRFAQGLAALAVGLSPVLCSFGMKMSTDTPSLWLWPLAALYLLRALRGDARSWVGVGLALGVAAETKYSVIYFAVALLAGVLCTRHRRALASRGFLVAVAIAVAIALPSFVWQAMHGFPMAELLRNGQRGKNVILSPGAFLLAELLITSPLLAPIWLAGLVHLLRREDARPLGLGFLFLIAAMIASHAKHYYPAAAYPILFAAGGVAFERVAHARAWVKPAALAVAALGGLVLLPYAMPILPIPTFLSYHRAMAKLGLMQHVRTENHRDAELPQDWADMQGWRELARTVEEVYAKLPPEDRAHAAIVAGNYGQAAAIEFFGRGLPPVLSGHNQYFLWGPRGADGEVLIDVDGDCGQGLHLYRSTERAATSSSPLGMPYEDQLPIMVCRGINQPFAGLWPSLKTYR